MDRVLGGGGTQSARVGMRRGGEDLLHLAAFDDLPGVHDHRPVAQIGHHAQVVGDEDDGHAEPVAQGPQQVEDLGLDGDVERGGRFVGDQQIGFAREGQRDAHALRSSGTRPCPLPSSVEPGSGSWPSGPV
ncbi:hypothetical protein [Streptomyces sp. NPDC096132]|uniref:hypothetical protein n=1 Tax=Streptomyces sp. NPDC096132 TaxID=3366075 RepID=UPI0037FB6203